MSFSENVHTPLSFFLFVLSVSFYIHPSSSFSLLERKPLSQGVRQKNRFRRCVSIYRNTFLETVKIISWGGGLGLNRFEEV